MSWLYSRALVEEYLLDTHSDGARFAQSSGNPTPQAYLPSDKMTAFSRPSRFGMTFAPLMENSGAELLTWYLVASHARTYQQQDGAQELKASIAGCGEKWHESSVKYCPVLCSWKTHRSLWEEALQWSSVILPRWGMTRNGVVFQHPIWERPISAIGFGLQPDNESFFHTPTCGGMDGGSNSRKALKKRQEAFATPQARDYRSGQASRWDDPARSRNLNDQIAKYPTPQASDNRDRGCRSTPAIARRIAAGKQVMLSMMVSEENGRLNPEFVEWLMGWPQGWTDLKPLEMGRFREWQLQHGGF